MEFIEQILTTISATGTLVLVVFIVYAGVIYSCGDTLSNFIKGLMDFHKNKKNKERRNS